MGFGRLAGASKAGRALCRRSRGGQWVLTCWESYDQNVVACEAVKCCECALVSRVSSLHLGRGAAQAELGSQWVLKCWESHDRNVVACKAVRCCACALFSREACKRDSALRRRSWGGSGRCTCWRIRKGSRLRWFCRSPRAWRAPSRCPNCRRHAPSILVIVIGAAQNGTSMTDFKMSFRCDEFPADGIRLIPKQDMKLRVL